MDQRSLFEAEAEAEAEGKNLLPSAEGRSRRFKNQHLFAQKIEEYLFIMLLKLVILTLPYTTLAIGLKIINF